MPCSVAVTGNRIETLSLVVKLEYIKILVNLKHVDLDVLDVVSYCQGKLQTSSFDRTTMSAKGDSKRSCPVLSECDNKSVNFKSWVRSY